MSYLLSPQFVAYNKNCDRLAEVESSSIDFVITSPPYNLGHGMPDANDQVPNDAFRAILKAALSGSFRILRQSGCLIIDIAESIDLPGEPGFRSVDFICRECTALGFQLDSTMVYVSMEPQSSKGFDRDFDLCEGRGHSDRQHVLVFRKDNIPRRWLIRMKSVYCFGSGYEEVCWPVELVNDLRLTFHVDGKRVVDPFAGRALLAQPIVRSGGTFIAYEVSRQMFLKHLVPGYSEAESVQAP